jgi:hypothetical protein
MVQLGIMDCPGSNSVVLGSRSGHNGCVSWHLAQGGPPIDVSALLVLYCRIHDVPCTYLTMAAQASVGWST